MSAIVLDTLDYAIKLKAGGFSEQQAETQARALAEVLERQILTKTEAAEHENTLRRDIETLRVDLKHDIELLRAEVKRDIADMNTRLAETKADLTRWVVGVGVLQTTVIIGVLMKVAKLI